jgi:hypothetical protein
VQLQAKDSDFLMNHQLLLTIQETNFWLLHIKLATPPQSLSSTNMPITLSLISCPPFVFLGRLRVSNRLRRTKTVSPPRPQKILKKDCIHDPKSIFSRITSEETVAHNDANQFEMGLHRRREDKTILTGRCTWFHIGIFISFCVSTIPVILYLWWTFGVETKVRSDPLHPTPFAKVPQVVSPALIHEVGESNVISRLRWRRKERRKTKCLCLIPNINIKKL